MRPWRSSPPSSVASIGRGAVRAGELPRDGSCAHIQATGEAACVLPEEIPALPDVPCVKIIGRRDVLVRGQRVDADKPARRGRIRKNLIEAGLGACVAAVPPDRISYVRASRTTKA
jgi:hypothetical protein